MSRTKLEVADIFRDHGPAWRQANAGRVSLEQLKVMSAIENCRTAELGGHVARCENAACGHTQSFYNSCLMGKFLNGELASGYVWESVKFGDFALHYGWPRWMCWIRLGVKSFFARMRLRKGLDAFEILIGGRIVAFSDSVPESAFGLSELTHSTMSRRADPRE